MTERTDGGPTAPTTGRTTAGVDGGDVTVVMTGAGAPGASGIVRSLRRGPEHDVRIVGVDMDPEAYGFALVDETETVPAGDDEAYVPAIRDIVDDVGADVVLPLTNPELEPLADAREEIDAEVMVSPTPALEVANDKGRLYQFLAEVGMDVAPEFHRVSSREAFREAVAALGYPERPVCFKRPVASGMRGFRVLREEGQELDRLLYEKPKGAVTTLEDVLPVLDGAAEFPELVVMEYLPGEEYSVDLLGMGDEVGPVVPRSRERTRAGISFEGTVERREDLIDAAGEISRRLGLEYNVNVQFRHDANGTPKVIEINPRVAGTIVMCVAAGANLPYLGLRYALDEPVPEIDVTWGTRMTRFWRELFRSPDGETYELGP